MGTAITISHTNFLSVNYLFLLLLCIFCSFKEGYGLGRRAAADTHTNTIHVSSLLPSSVCNPSHKALDRKSSLPVVHKHGPCSQLQQQDKANVPTHADAEILLLDEARVKSIHSKLANKPAFSAVNVEETNAASLPARSGQVVGSGNYIVTVGLGTPKKDLSLIFDTGSDITWTQCQPCAKSCYKQQDPIFTPSQSSTYSNISCTSKICTSLTSATGISPSCSSSACVYGIQYGDSSFSVGIYAEETLTLTSTDVFQNFYFGCGQKNQGLFNGSAGLLGLGRNNLSLPSQTALKYKNFFSYCLPSSASSTGFLSFGNSGALSKSVKFTPLSKMLHDTYGIDITGISVGGQKLSISASVFTTAGAIIDSGTVITRLPATAYAALRSAFRQAMSKYPMGKPLPVVLDTCYDFSNYTTVSVPKISFFLGGGVEVPIDLTGIFFASDISQVCLAFAGNGDDGDVAIFGNTQQKTLEVVYDGAGGRIGFGTKGCT